MTDHNKQQLDEILIRRHGMVIFPTSTTPGPRASSASVATVLANLSSLGYTLDSLLISNATQLSEDELVLFYRQVEAQAKELVGYHVDHRPMYPNFPAQVMEASSAELFLNAIVHYITAGQLLPEYEKVTRPILKQRTTLKVIRGVSSYQPLIETVRALASANSSISETDTEDLKVVFATPTLRNEVISVLPEVMPFKEVSAVICALILEHLDSNIAEPLVKSYMKTATDVLRLAVAMSNGDVSLAADSRFRSFTWKERHFFLYLLDRMGNLEEDMDRFPEKWLVFGQGIHPGDKRFQRHTKAVAAFAKLRSGEKLDTFNRRISKTEYKVDFGILDLLAQRPGEFARRLDHLLRVNPGRQMDILFVFQKVAAQVSVPVLMQVRSHFEHMHLRKAHRDFFIKGSTSKIYSKNDDREPIPQLITEQFVRTCDTALTMLFHTLPSLGKVYLDPALHDYLVPFSERSASGRALRTVTRGSRIPFTGDSNFIRLFVYWKEPEGDRTDLDLSASFVDENWNSLARISFRDLRDHGINASHSGDITSAPNGASEFIDIDIESCRRAGVRYVSAFVYSYTSTPFAQLPECFFGWMERTSQLSGEIFEPSTVQQKIDITADGTSIMPVIFDIEDRKFIWTDTSVPSLNYGANALEENSFSTAMISRAITTMVKPTLYDLFLLHTQARGTQVWTREEADTVFDETTGITPFDINIIRSEFLVAGPAPE